MRNLFVILIIFCLGCSQNMQILKKENKRLQK